MNQNQQTRIAVIALIVFCVAAFAAVYAADHGMISAPRPRSTPSYATPRPRTVTEAITLSGATFTKRAGILPETRNAGAIACNVAAGTRLKIDAWRELNGRRWYRAIAPPHSAAPLGCTGWVIEEDITPTAP